MKNNLIYQHKSCLRFAEYTAVGVACTKWGVETKKHSTTHKLDVTNTVMEMYVISNCSDFLGWKSLFI